MNMKMKVLAVSLTAGLAIATGGCSDSQVEPEAGTAATPPGASQSSPDVTATPAASVPEEVQGTWLLDVPKQQIGANLESAGFGKWVERFYKSEGLDTERVQLALTLAPDSFDVAWRLADTTWDSGWTGPVRAEGDVLHFDDDHFAGVTDSYRPSVDGDQLTLTFVKTNVDEVRGIPSEAYSRAYFSQPWTRGDCTSDDLDACL